MLQLVKFRKNTKERRQYCNLSTFHHGCCSESYSRNNRFLISCVVGRSTRRTCRVFSPLGVLTSTLHTLSCGLSRQPLIFFALMTSQKVFPSPHSCSSIRFRISSLVGSRDRRISNVLVPFRAMYVILQTPSCDPKLALTFFTLTT